MSRYFLGLSFLAACLCIFGQPYICLAASRSSLPEYMDNLVFENRQFTQPVQVCFPNEDSRANLQEIRTTHFGLEKVFYCAGYQVIDKQLLTYLLNHELAQVESARVRAQYGPGNTHYFLFYTDKFKRLPNLSINNNQPCLNVAKRVVKSIDYQNTYKGSPRGIEMQFYAITFSYVLEGNLPELPKIEKTYQGKAKAYKDPDDGKWKLDNFELQDRGNEEFMSQIRVKYEKYDPQNIIVSSPILFTTAANGSDFFDLFGVFEGEIRIYQNQIDIKIPKATLSRRDNPAYKGKRIVTSIKASMARETVNSWQITKRGNSIPMERLMMPGDKYTVQDTLNFSIPKDEYANFRADWLLFEIVSLSPDREKEHQISSSFVHSEHNIFQMISK